MKTNIIKKKYAGFEISISYNEYYSDFSYLVKDKDQKILLQSRRNYDSSDDAYVRACMRINDEL